MHKNKVLDRASQVALVIKNPPASAGDIRDAGSIPGSGRSPEEGHGNPLQYSCQFPELKPRDISLTANSPNIEGEYPATLAHLVFEYPISRSLCVCAKLLQSCLTLCDPMDCSPTGSSVHGILQARILEWIAMPFFR